MAVSRWYAEVCEWLFPDGMENEKVEKMRGVECAEKEEAAEMPEAGELRKAIVRFRKVQQQFREESWMQEMTSQMEELLAMRGAESAAESTREWKWIAVAGIIFVLLIDGLTWAHLAAAEKVRIQRLERTREEVLILLEESKLKDGDSGQINQRAGEGD